MKLRNLLFLFLLLLLVGQVLAERKIHLQSRIIEPTKSKTASSVANIQTSNYWIVQFSDIPSENNRMEMERHGVQFIGYLPDYAWLMFVPAQAMPWLQSKSPTYLGPWQAQDKALHGLYQRVTAMDPQAQVKIKGAFFEATHGNSVLSTYSSEFAIDGSSFTATIEAKDIAHLLSEDSLHWITDRIPEKTTFNANARALIDVDTIQASPYNLNGTGVWIAEWDSGWAGNHIALENRTTIGDSATCNASASDTGSCSIVLHSTHVAGTMIGNGTGSATNYGMALSARLVSWEWFDSFTELFFEYNKSLVLYNASVSQNSWGYAASPVDASNCMALLGNYYTDNIWVDNATRGSVGRSIPIVWSAGNERTVAAGYCGNVGFTNYNTTTPMGTSKNVITIGAVDDSAGMSSFSSWGPTDDGRIKPDVVSNGVGLTSTVPTDSYGSSDGTSMAAPTVSGTIALLVQAHRLLHSWEPDAAFMKALLLHTAVDLNNTGPDYTTGFGFINASAAYLLMQRDVNETLFFNGTFTASSQSRNISIEVPGGTQELKLTLVWSDYPGSVAASTQLVNDLDLIVINSSGSRFYPWTLDSNNPGTAAVRTQKDSLNPMEQIVISLPASGSYNITINATTIAQPSQSYWVIASLHDTLPPRWTLNQTNLTRPNTGSAVQFNITWADGSGLSNYTFAWNDTGTWVNVSNGTFTGTMAVASVTNLVTASSDSTLGWQMYARDSLGNTNQTEVFTLPVGNAIPQLTAVTITSTDLLNRTNGTLMGAFTFTDADSVNITNLTRWYNGSALYPNATNQTQLSSAFTVKGENWTFSAQVSDGINVSQWLNASMVIANTAPELQHGNISARESQNLTFILNATDIDQDSLNYTVNNSFFQGNGSNRFTFVTNVNTTNVSISYSLNFTVNDSSTITSILVLASLSDEPDIENDGIPDFADQDDDNDGVNDSLDNVFGNASSINSTFSRLNVTFNQSGNMSLLANGTYAVNISNGTSTVLAFNITLNASSIFSFFNVTLVKQSTGAANGSLLVRGIALQNLTKSAYVDRIAGLDRVCVKDASVTSLSSVSRGCSAEHEVFLTCDGSSSGGYSCSLAENSSRYLITGLNHSAIIEQCQDADSDNYGVGCSAGTDCDDTDSAKTTSCSSGSSGSSGGGGGGGGGGGAGKAISSSDPAAFSKTFAQMKTDTIFEIKELRSKLAITRVLFQVNAFVLRGEVNVNIQDPPQPLEGAYQFFEISLGGVLLPQHILLPTLEFRVPNTYLSEKDQVNLYRFENSWKPYPVKQIKNDSAYTYYSATVPGFSSFAIKALSKTQNESLQQVIQEDVLLENVNESASDFPEEITSEKVRKSPSWWGVLFVAGIIAFVVFWIKNRKK